MKTKDYLFYGCLVLILLGLFLIMYVNQEEESEIVIAVKTTYSLLYDEQKPLNVPLYVNKKHSPLKDAKLIDVLMLLSASGDLKLEIDRFDLTIGHAESYLNQTFTQINFHLYLPYFGEDMHIKDAMIKITLTNGVSYLLEIGEVFLSYKTHHQPQRIDFESLYGIKSLHSGLSRLKSIYMHLTPSDLAILTIDLGGDLIVSFEQSNQLLKIHIPYRASLLYDVPIRIHYADGHIDYVDNFIYIIDYQILKESGPLLYVYTPN